MSHRARWLSATALIVVACLAAAAARAQPPGEPAIPLPSASRMTPALEASLASLQDLWLLWNSTYQQGDADLAHSAVRSLALARDELGFRRLPHLADGALLRAAEAAREDDFDRAELALEAAEILDPRRAATAFVRARVDWASGRPLGAARSQVLGYGLLLRSSLARTLILHNAATWMLLSLIVTAVLFIALQMGTKGASLLRDLRTSARRFLPGVLGILFAVPLLAWPALLPNAWLWLSLLWAVLLYTYCSTSERWALGVSVLLLGAVPVALAWLPRQTGQVLGPHSVLMERLDERQLYGDLLQDLEQLREDLPESPAVTHLTADVHLGLGQAEVARPNYRRVAEEEPSNGAALNNLGAFHYFRKEYVPAIEFLSQAERDERAAAAAAYNLSQSYAALLEFDNASSAVSRANAAAPVAAAEWFGTRRPAVTLFGGLRRTDEIRRQVAALAPGAPSRLEDLLPLAVSVLALLLAVVVKSVNEATGRGWRPLAVEPNSRLERWAHRLIPGLRPAVAGDGGAAFFEVFLPVMVLCLPLAAIVGYQIPWGVEPAPVGSWSAALLALLVWFLVRLRSAW